MKSSNIELNKKDLGYHSIGKVSTIMPKSLNKAIVSTVQYKIIFIEVGDWYARFTNAENL